MLVVLVVIVVGPVPPGTVIVLVGAVVAGGFAGKEGDGAQETFKPLGKAAKPSGPRGSEGPGGTVPVNMLKL